KLSVVPAEACESRDDSGVETARVQYNQLQRQLTARCWPGTVSAHFSRAFHVLRCHVLDSLHAGRRGRAGCAQCDAAVADGAAWHLGCNQYPLPVRLSVLGAVLCYGADRIRRPRAMAGARVLAVAAARRAVPDRRYRHDAG